MSGGRISDYLIFKRMPAGRDVFALSQSKKVADELHAERLSAAADAAIALGHLTLDTEAAWATTKKQRANRGNAQLVKNKVVRQLSSIRDIAAARASSEPGEEGGEHDIPALAEEVLDTCFPGGVDVIAQQPYESLIGTLGTMIKKLNAELSEHVRALGLSREVSGLIRLTAQLDAELQPKGEQVDWDDVEQKRDDLHEATCRFIVAVLDQFSGGDEESVRQRRSLLGPLDTQQAYVAEYRARHRDPLDVDPTTGDEIPDGPAGGGGPAAPVGAA